MYDRTVLTDDNFNLYAAKHYNNPQCFDVEEFEEDLKRFKYIKRLLNKYIEYGDLRERLILNHIISLNNVFDPSITAKMLFVKLAGYESYLVPFLSMLGSLPPVIYGIGKHDRAVKATDIHVDSVIEDRLNTI